MSVFTIIRNNNRALVQLLNVYTIHVRGLESTKTPLVPLWSHSVHLPYSIYLLFPASGYPYFAVISGETMNFYHFVLDIHQLPSQPQELPLVGPQQLAARARCGGEEHRKVVYLRRHLNTPKRTNLTARREWETATGDTPERRGGRERRDTNTYTVTPGLKGELRRSQGSLRRVRVFLRELSGTHHRGVMAECSPFL